MITKERCSGCSACENICPTNAITLKIDNLTGFKLAEIDTAKCINCGKCDSVCPHNTLNLHDTLEQKRYAMKSTDEKVLKNSSSGGAFTIITKPLLEQGWKVVGVRWNKDWHAEYAIADTIEEWEKFRKSKYMQADMNDVYPRVKELLDKGERVVFTGIPCHVSGLLNFLGKKYDNLLTIDLLCNSLPSPKIWDEWYKYEGLDKSTFTNIDMRPKLSISCTNRFLQLKKNNDNIHNILMSATPIWGLTISGHLTTLDICGECKYKCYKRVSDITIGDLWNGNKECPELWNKMDSNLSSCMTNTAKGQNILKSIKCDYISKEINDVKLPPNFKAKNSFEQFKGIDKLGLDKFLDKFIKKHKEKEFPYDIALCGGTLNNNFGATLTYYALYKYLESLNYKTVIIPPMAKKDRGGMDEGNVFEKYCNIAPNYFAQGKPNSFNDLADTFMIGSDQTWKSTIIGRLGLKPFLDYVNYKKNKIVYSVSYGTTNESAYNKHPQFVDELRRLINKFDYISHREKEGCDITKNWYHRNDSVHCIDPVFLVDINEYEKLVDESNVTLPNNDYLCFYTLTRPIETYNFVHELSRELNYDEIIIGNGLKNANNKQREKFPDENFVNPILAQDWLKYIKNCKCLITDSFHGICFAILFNKPFICLKYIKDIRINWLLKCAELEENYMKILDTNKAKYLINKNIDVKYKFNEFIDFSKKWLDDILLKISK